MGFFKANKMMNGYSKLKLGMSKDEVLRMFGQPTGVRNINGVTMMTWKNSEFKGAMRGGTMVREVIVDFENDVVVGYDSRNMDRSTW